MRLDLARKVADAVLYEGYLLYPYRASSSKNQARWQFGVLGPVGAEDAGVGESATMSIQCLLTSSTRLVVHLRFLQLQHRVVHDADGMPVAELTDADGTSWMTWDEAVEHELTFELSEFDLEAGGTVVPVTVAGGEDVELLGHDAGRVVRHRWPLTAEMRIATAPADGCLRLDVAVLNLHDGAGIDAVEATRHSFIGTHVILEAHDAEFVSLLEPPEELVAAAAACSQHRCWPVLGGDAGDTDLVLGLPIILYDHPEIAAESPGALFDATEIDEILTLRVMTMTDEEKAEARATDPRAREIIDRCDAMTPETMAQMHGILRNPHTGESPPQGSVEPEWPELSDWGHLPLEKDADVEPPTFTTDDPWWDPEADASVSPETDSVMIDGVKVSKGSLVTVHPSRRADAQDLFFANQVARVTAVLSDVDGGTHVALVLVDDPAAEMHDWYGRYFYFSPDELEPMAVAPSADREEIRP
ncbi:hypothetical protein [Aeromicrobium sp.]|uniref:hypothetical protein n=1 Tax=Aeromicrobium sp. TaxID=1871063 RepID=UPI003C41CAE2